MNAAEERSAVLRAFDRFHGGVFVLYLVSLLTSMSGMELFSTLLGVCLLAQLLISRAPRERWVFPPFLLPLLVFIAVIWIGIFFGSAPRADKLYDARRIRFFLIYVVLFYQLRFFSRRPETWLNVFFWVGCLVGVYGFIQHFTPLDLFRPEGKKVFLYAIQDEKIGPLVVGTFNHHLTFANIFMLHACVLFAYGLAQGRAGLRWTLLGTLFFLLCAWTQSRAAWAAIPVCLLIAAWVGGSRWAGGAGIFASAGLALFYFIDEGFRERLQRTLVSPGNYNVGSRFRLWRMQWEMFKERPLFGVGYNNNERFCAEELARLYPDLGDRFCGHAHSTPLQLLSTTGAAGVLTYVALWWGLFRRCSRFLGAKTPNPTRALAFGCLAAFVGFHIQGVTQWNFGDAEVMHNLMFLWAVVANFTDVVPTAR